MKDYVNGEAYKEFVWSSQKLHAYGPIQTKLCRCHYAFYNLQFLTQIKLENFGIKTIKDEKNKKIYPKIP